jgi:hypothetical protein
MKRPAERMVAIVLLALGSLGGVAYWSNGRLRDHAASRSTRLA